MRRTAFALAALAAIAACGRSSPTTASRPSDIRTGEAVSTQQTDACPAQSIALVYTPIGPRHVITAVFLDARSNDVAPMGCQPLTWSVSPQGASVQPLSDGSSFVTQGELIVTGAAQLYTVTAVSGTMSASVGVTAGR